MNKIIEDAKYYIELAKVYISTHETLVGNIVLGVVIFLYLIKWAKGYVKSDDKAQHKATFVIFVAILVRFVLSFSF